MTRVELYRARAQEAEELARHSHHPEAKSAFERVARGWRELAAQFEPCEGAPNPAEGQPESRGPG